MSDSHAADADPLEEHSASREQAAVQRPPAASVSVVDSEGDATDGVASDAGEAATRARTSLDGSASTAPGPTAQPTRSAQRRTSPAQRRASPAQSSAVKVGVKRKQRWTKAEGQSLRRAVEAHGDGDWNVIAAEVKTRTARQCKDHYNEVIGPHVNRGDWSVEEELRLAHLHAHIGPAWTRICQHMPGRPANACKNKFNGTQRHRHAEDAVLSVYIRHLHQGSSLKLDADSRLRALAAANALYHSHCTPPPAAPPVPHVEHAAAADARPIDGMPAFGFNAGSPNMNGGILSGQLLVRSRGGSARYGSRRDHASAAESGVAPAPQPESQRGPDSGGVVAGSDGRKRPSLQQSFVSRQFLQQGAMQAQPVSDADFAACQGQAMAGDSASLLGPDAASLGSGTFGSGSTATYGSGGAPAFSNGGTFGYSGLGPLHLLNGATAPSIRDLLSSQSGPAGSLGSLANGGLPAGFQVPQGLFGPQNSPHGFLPPSAGPMHASGVPQGAHGGAVGNAYLQAAQFNSLHPPGLSFGYAPDMSFMRGALQHGVLPQMHHLSGGPMGPVPMGSPLGNAFDAASLAGLGSDPTLTRQPNPAPSFSAPLSHSALYGNGGCAPQDAPHAPPHLAMPSPPTMLSGIAPAAQPGRANAPNPPPVFELPRDSHKLSR